MFVLNLDPNDWYHNWYILYADIKKTRARVKCLKKKARKCRFESIRVNHCSSLTQYLLQKLDKKSETKAGIRKEIKCEPQFWSSSWFNAQVRPFSRERKWRDRGTRTIVIILTANAVTWPHQEEGKNGKQPIRHNRSSSNMYVQQIKLNTTFSLEMICLCSCETEGKWPEKWRCFYHV